MFKNNFNIERRLKKKILSGKHNFFAIYPPGFKEIAENDFLENYAIGIDSFTSGGFEFEAALSDAWIINSTTQSLTRVLMRISEFKAMYFSEYRKLLSKTEWELYLNPSLPINIKVTCSASRLYHTDRIKSETYKAIQNRFNEVLEEKVIIKKESDFQNIYVRIKDNRVVVSLDTSGEPLYKRGVKKYSVKAPLRENMAYMLLKEAGLSEAEMLYDPMCGAGTFSLEAMMFSYGKIPGDYREFAFRLQPAFKEKRYEYELDIYRKNISINKSLKIMISDNNSESVKAASENIKVLGEKNNPGNLDFFNINNKSISEKAIIALNPPYGKRIKSENIYNLYKKIFSKINSVFKDCGYILIIPENVELKPYGYDRVIDFHNGGLSVKAFIKKVK